MKTPPYCREFSDRMTLKNRACRTAGNHREIYALVPGPSDNWAVLDLSTDIELGSGYEWSFWTSVHNTENSLKRDAHVTQKTQLLVN